MGQSTQSRKASYTPLSKHVKTVEYIITVEYVTIIENSKPVPQNHSIKNFMMLIHIETII